MRLSLPATLLAIDHRYLMPSNFFMFRHKGEKAFDEVSFSFYCFPNGNIMSSSCLMDHDSYTSAFSVVKSLNFLPKIIFSAIDKYRSQAWCFNQTGLEKIFQAFTFLWPKICFHLSKIRDMQPWKNS